MSSHRCDGLFPADKVCGTNINGLFAAGDALCSAGVHGGGVSSSGCAVQGAKAGLSASAFAKSIKENSINEDNLKRVLNNSFRPRKLEKGFSSTWSTQLLQSIMTPYYVLLAKSEDRLQAALINIDFLKTQVAPNLVATDAHELRLVHETRNMILNAEMKLKASIFRKETRTTHYREDYPERDDSWNAWVILKQAKDGSMDLEKRQIPSNWLA